MLRTAGLRLPRMLKLTQQEMFGGNDEEFQRGGDVEDMPRRADGLPSFMTGSDGPPPREPHRIWPRRSPTPINGKPMVLRMDAVPLT